MRRGRKLSQKSLQILNSVLYAGLRTFSDIVEGGHEYDRRLYRATYKAIFGLRNNGYLQIRKDRNNKSFFHLTPKGKLSILKYLHLEKLMSKKWDHRWRVIVFDIPENLKKWREYLRKELKDLGFLPLQESVYITPFPVTGELDELLKARNLRKYFRYLTVTEIDGIDDLQRQFEIK